MAGLLGADHVQTRSIDIHGTPNRTDIALYIHNRLRYVSLAKRLGTDWPHPQLELDFTAKAEGLFLWVATSPITYAPSRIQRRSSRRFCTNETPEASCRVKDG